MKAQLAKFFGRLPLTVYLVAGGVAVFGGWLTINNRHQREVGKRELQIVQYEMANRDLRRANDSLAQVYRVDTLRLTRLKLQTDTLTQTVERWKRDTLKVVEYVVRADSTIAACTQALQTCEARVLVAQKGWTGAREELKVLKASFPSPVQKYRWLVGGVIGGAVIGYVAKP